MDFILIESIGHFPGVVKTPAGIWYAFMQSTLFKRPVSGCAKMTHKLIIIH